MYLTKIHKRIKLSINSRKDYFSQIKIYLLNSLSSFKLMHVKHVTTRHSQLKPGKMFAQTRLSF